MNEKMLRLLAEYREQTRDCWLDQQKFEQEMPDISTFGIDEDGRVNARAEEIYSAVARLRGNGPNDARLSELARAWLSFMRCADDSETAKRLAAAAADDKRIASCIDSRFGVGTAMLLRLACEEILR